MAYPHVARCRRAGTSFYVVSGLPADVPHVVAITALTGAADLHVFADATYSFELDCTFRSVHGVIGIAQDCTVTDRSALYFSVSSGAKITLAVTGLIDQPPPQPPSRLPSSPGGAPLRPSRP